MIVRLVSEVEITEKVVNMMLEAFKNRINIDVKHTIIEKIESAYNKARRQYNGELLLRYLEYLYGTTSNVKYVFIIDDDGYAVGLNFIFGIARLYGNHAIVFTSRLYINADKDLFYNRLVKEINHELGHLLGLNHCDNPRCVMYFSNTLMDTDYKDYKYCERCFSEIESILSH